MWNTYRVKLIFHPGWDTATVETIPKVQVYDSRLYCCPVLIDQRSELDHVKLTVGVEEGVCWTFMGSPHDCRDILKAFTFWAMEEDDVHSPSRHSVGIAWEDC